MRIGLSKLFVSVLAILFISNLYAQEKNQVLEYRKSTEEVLEKIALVGVVAVAQDHLAVEVLLIVAQFHLNIRHLRVKLVGFVSLGFI